MITNKRITLGYTETKVGVLRKLKVIGEMPDGSRIFPKALVVVRADDEGEIEEDVFPITKEVEQFQFDPGTYFMYFRWDEKFDPAPPVDFGHGEKG